LKADAAKTAAGLARQLTFAVNCKHCHTGSCFLQDEDADGYDGDFVAPLPDRPRAVPGGGDTIDKYLRRQLRNSMPAMSLGAQ
jgi:hypothetical protein